MNIQLKKLNIRNFKGIKELTIKFGKETIISGKNATGKTTVFDAFTWLLFGKDTTGRADFQLKTVDKNGKELERIEHEVSATIESSGYDIELKRIYKEKWIKKRGALEPEYAGNTEEFFYNDVPLSKADYQAKINAILDEEIFRLITNPAYFNSLKWEKRRQLLLDIAGEISDADILKGINNTIFIKSVMDALSQGKKIDEFKREISAKKKKIKEQLDTIPARIDEQNRSLPAEENWDHIEFTISEKEKELMKIDAELLDKSKAVKESQSKKIELQKKLNLISQKRAEITSKIMNDVMKEDSERKSVNEANKLKLSSISRQKNVLVDEFHRNNEMISVLKIQREKLISNWKTENAKELVFDENEFSCPTCHREFEAADIDAQKAEMTAFFNENKKKILSEITEEGKKIKEKIEAYEKENVELKEKIAEFDKDFLKFDALIKDFDSRNANQLPNEQIVKIRMDASDELKSLAHDEEILNNKLKEIPDIVTDEQLLRTKEKIKSEIYDLKDRLTAKVVIKKINERIEELKEEEGLLAGSLANLEGIEFAILEFTKAKMNVLESRINGKFSTCKFRLFETQINGGEVPCCETLIDGVPYQDANHAAHINTGLDIINVFCKFYDVTAPIFIDNAEAVNEIFKTNSQTIKLIVTEDKKLKVEIKDAPLLVDMLKF